MRVEIKSRAIKDLRKIGPASTAILAKIKQYAADPTSLANNIKALKGTEMFRLRVGDYRVLFALESDGSVTVMMVEAIRHRREAYD